MNHNSSSDDLFPKYECTFRYVNKLFGAPNGYWLWQKIT